MEDFPTIKVLWDPEKQEVSVQFQTDQFKTWDFVDAILNMAKAKCQEANRMSKVQQMQQAVAMAQQEQQLRRQIMQG